MRKETAAIAALAGTVLALSLSMTAEAGDRTRSGTVQGGKGRTGTFQQDVHREKGSRTGQTTVHGSGGGSVTHDSTRTARDPDGTVQKTESGWSGTGTWTTTTTGPGGNSRTRSGSATVTSTTGGPK